MVEEARYPATFRVCITKPAKRAGDKLFAQPKNRLWLIRELKSLKHWPANSSEYDHERVWGAIELKFNKIEDKWVRVFAYEDRARDIIWIIAVFAKKSNELSATMKIRVETAVSRIREEIKEYEKQLRIRQQRKNLGVVEGGRKV